MNFKNRSTGSDGQLIDSYGRRMRKLRVSLTEVCNFRCFYCMPEDTVFAPHKNNISHAEIVRICKVLLGFGLEQVRLTGGEPFLRKDALDIIESLSQLNLQKLGVTTNGFRLLENLDRLRGTQCLNLNVSLDSLDAVRFKQITKKDLFDRVLKGIFQAKEMGFNIKINVVLMRGVNDIELRDFYRFSKTYGINVRFLELMKIGQGNEFNSRYFLSAREAMAQLEGVANFSIKSVEADSTSVEYVSSDGAMVGFIASETEPFCSSCSRLRLSNEGYLRACLMSEEGVSIRGLQEVEMHEAAVKVMRLKPNHRIENLTQNMYEIGG